MVNKHSGRPSIIFFVMFIGTLLALLGGQAIASNVKSIGKAMDTNMLLKMRVSAEHQLSNARHGILVDMNETQKSPSDLTYVEALAKKYIAGVTVDSAKDAAFLVRLSPDEKVLYDSQMGTLAMTSMILTDEVPGAASDTGVQATLKRIRSGQDSDIRDDNYIIENGKKIYLEWVDIPAGPGGFDGVLTGTSEHKVTTKWVMAVRVQEDTVSDYPGMAELIQCTLLYLNIGLGILCVLCISIPFVAIRNAWYTQQEGE